MFNFIRAKKQSAKIKIGLHYCKDILNPEMGKHILGVITDCFSGNKWQLVTRSDVITLDTGNVHVVDSTIKKYVNQRWQRIDDDIDLMSISSMDDEVGVRILTPALGGAKLLTNDSGAPYFNQAAIHMSFSNATATPAFEESMVRCVTGIGLAVEASYGSASSLDQAEVWRLDHRLKGVFWLTWFGPEYVELIGRDTLDAVSCYSKQWLPDGSLLMRLTEKFRDSLTSKGEAHRKKAMEEIGLIWFRDRTDPTWYPPLRNLVFPENS